MTNTDNNNTRFTTKDIRKVKGHFSGRPWYTLEVEPMEFNGREYAGLYVDIAESRYDKRDRILSIRRDFELDQDAGVVEVYANKYYKLADLKLIAVAVANALASDPDLTQYGLQIRARKAGDALYASRCDGTICGQ